MSLPLNGRPWFDSDGSGRSRFSLVGFDARYGNPTFIKDGENGYLFPYSETMDEDLLVSQMADKILFALESDLESMHKPHMIAKQYLKLEILEAWRKLLIAIR